MPKLNRWFRMLKPLRRKMQNVDKPSTLRTKLTHQSITLSNNCESTVTRSHKMSKIRSTVMFLP